MKTESYPIKYGTLNTKAVDYKGVQILYNCLNGRWMLQFSKEGKYRDQMPFVGTLAQMKSIIDTAIKLNKDGENQLLQAGTYTRKEATK
jgi:hypothetical protein